MKLPALTGGRILRRYKRFLADVELEDGRQVVAHCPNTGAMDTCWEPGAPAQVSHSDNPKRKLAWTLERVDMGQGWVGVHTGRTNPVNAEGIERQRIAPLRGYPQVRREVGFTAPGHPRSRIDLELSGGSGRDALVEIKNATLLGPQAVLFPDAVTERGRKHLDVLAEAVRQGKRGVVLFAVNRPEGDGLRPAWERDPAYCRRLAEVVEAGVEALAVRLLHTAGGIEVGPALALDLRRP